ncbi:MAG: hypothetical protein HY901_20910 [Deltaproteobacteria bacterium]|nr:hypothetical protein [Deltaproteobacteria bacterium]
MLRLRVGLCCSLFALVLTACPAGTADTTDGGGVSRDGGTNPKTDGGAAIEPVAPELTSAQAQISGRTGRDLRFTVKGHDQNLDVVGLWVRLLDAQGQPVLAFDSDRDGTLDSASGPVGLDDQKLVGESLTATATLRKLLDKVQSAAQVGVALQDATNLRSEEMVAPVVAQPVLSMGDACDPLFLANRCAAGLGCRGTPPTCKEGLAPEITRMAFLKGANGPSILIEGTEPEDDLVTIHFGFQNAQGQPTSIDSDGDGTADLESFDFDATGQAVDGTFFIRMQPADGLDQQVSKLTASAADLAAHQGALKTASPTTTPVRSAGQACDPRGFDVCAANLACTPGVVGKPNVCQSASTLRTTQCGAAPILVATAAGATALGTADGVSLWDTPAGCQSNDPKGRPEGLVTLRLTERAQRLTLSTEHPGTTFDTALYMLTGCPLDSTDSFGCSDDASAASSASRLVVENVPAGDYLVVVDSFSYEGGSFELSAQVE